MRLKLHIKLLSDATFGRGDGVAGVIDTEIEQESVTGLPCIKGRTLRGLIVEEAANLLEAIRLQNGHAIPREVETAAQALFGGPGSTDADAGALHVGAAQFPQDLREAVLREVTREDARGRLTRDDVLAMTTCIRRQTAMDEETDAPMPNSLRAQRAVVRNTLLEADLLFLREPCGLELPLLAAAIRCVRRGGAGRNRGRGALECRLYDAQGREADAAPLFEYLAAWSAEADNTTEVNR